MTEISVKRENGSIVFFEVSGHSGYAEAGNDIVCAAISSVVWNTVNGLVNVLGIPCDCTDYDGFVAVTIPSLPKKKRADADILLESMNLFLEDLIRQYGDYISKTEV